MKSAKALTVCFLFALLLAPAAAGSGGPGQVPLLPVSFSNRFFSDLDRADKAGRLAAIAKVGDSSMERPQNLYGLGCGRVDFADWEFLRKTLHLYTQVPQPGAICRRANSFSRRSAAARNRAPSGFALSEAARLPLGPSPFAGDPLCRRPGESALACEIRITRARWVLISTGSSDADWKISLAETRANLLSLVRQSRKVASVPVLLTAAPMITPDGLGLERARKISRTVVEVGEETGTPTINVWRKLQSLPGNGLSSDSFNLGYPAGNPLYTSADWSADSISFGANARNLLVLRALRLMDKAYIERRSG